VLAAGTSTALTWLLSKVVDRAGNNYVINYTSLTGTAVPYKILWTPTSAGGSAYAYTMQFNYTSNVPQSSIHGYVAGTLVSNTDLLSSIEIFSGTTVVKDYFLGYQASPLTGREELISEKECADSGGSNCLSPTSIGYETGTPGLSTTSNSALSGAGYTLTARYDLNGDGYPDLVYQSSSGAWYVAFGSASGYGTPVSTGINTLAFGLAGNALIGNLNGGTEDGILAPNGSDWWYYTWNGTTFAGASTGLAFDAAAFQYQLADINGDGLPDLINVQSQENKNGKYSETIGAQLNTSKGGTVSFSATGTSIYVAGGNQGAGLQTPDTQLGKLRRFDFNGDGLDDLVFVVSETSTVNTYELITTPGSTSTSLSGFLCERS
jgi:hypothetical protein